MSNVLLVTWTKSSNLGTSLQSLALYKVISRKHNCALLGERKYFSPLTFLREYIRVKKLRAKSARSSKKDCGKAASFDCFDGINLIDLNSKKQLKYILAHYDAFIAGSDQIWNPYFLRITYLLDFVPDGYKKISYASSIGVDKIPEKDIKIYKKYLKNFSYLSMRENRGAKYLSEITGRDIEAVLDPTLLLTADEWRDFSKTEDDGARPPERYALCYFIGGDGEFSNQVADVCKKLNLHAVYINCGNTEHKNAALDINGVTPQQFIKLIDGAVFICTDSFHMCAFSINFNKQFAAFDRFKNFSGNGAAGRIKDLFDTFNVNRFYSGDILENPIDYAPVNGILQSERRRCTEKLFNAIENQKTAH